MYAVAPEQNRVGIHLWLNYQLNYNDENMLSLLFHQSSFMGGAHPADYYYSCNIDLLSGKNIQLVDLFSKDYDYKTLINNYSRFGIIHLDKFSNFFRNSLGVIFTIRI